ncbi:hypothetical protein [Saccharopolyspora shandongensis]|uniref:hypothetical protein n=1 Tax=Saccharopolyspora shandongensis TaxID=418495 RepID=UPI00340483ED
MTTQTLDQRDETKRIDDVDEAAAPAKKPAATKVVKKREEKRSSKLGKAWGRLSPRKSGDGLPVVIWAGFFRLVVLIADYLLVFVTATVAIPMLGAWLHRQSGASQGLLTTAGSVAMWLMPLLFLVLILAAGEIAVMRAMWRWSTQRIQRVRAGRAGESETKATPQRSPVLQADHQSKKNNRKRSK